MGLSLGNETVVSICWTCLVVALLAFKSVCAGDPPNCGNTGGPCVEGMCCSKHGYCGTTPAYCSPDNCVSQCPTPSPPPPPPAPAGPPPPPGEGVASIITEEIYNKFLLHTKDPRCEASHNGGFYSYNAFISAANSFAGFGTTGDLETRKREIAAFFGQTSHETHGAWDTAPDGEYAWGYCLINERDQWSDYCNHENQQWPCCPGKTYHGRGPIQLSWNYNYGQAGDALGLNLLCNPEIVATDPVIAFKTAIWFWMTPQPPKPSCHEVITGLWTPSESDIAMGRLPGYGMCTNIINGGLECGPWQGPDAIKKQESRIGFYKRYCGILQVTYGENLYCTHMTPYGLAITLLPGLAETVV